MQKYLKLLLMARGTSCYETRSETSMQERFQCNRTQKASRFLETDYFCMEHYF